MAELHKETINYLQTNNVTSISKITPRVYLGSIEAALDTPDLKKRGITHIINAAKDATYDSELPQIRLHLDDIPRENLFRVLEPSRIVMNRILLTNSENKILVHCMAGVSRSASVVIYYLMKNEGLTYDQALAKVRKTRSFVNPNAGFEMSLKAVEGVKVA